MINLVDYELKEIFPRTFALLIKSDYQRAMLFLRCQEYYESSFPEIKGKNFDIFEYMEIYMAKRDSSLFTYPSDWGGFNVPGQIIETCIKCVFSQNSGVLPTRYDYIMKSIIDEIKSKIDGNKRWYLIGTDSEDSRTMEHELCHALYYTNPGYRKETNRLIKGIDPQILQKIKAILSDMGYCKSVLNDETQAYLSTGVSGEMSRIRGIKKLQKGFIKNFSKYRGIKKA